MLLSQHSMLGLLHVDDPRILSPHQLTKKKKKKKKKKNATFSGLDLLWRKFLDPRMLSIRQSVRPSMCLPFCLWWCDVVLRLCACWVTKPPYSSFHWAVRFGMRNQARLFFTIESAFVVLMPSSVFAITDWCYRMRHILRDNKEILSLRYMY